MAIAAIGLGSNLPSPAGTPTETVLEAFARLAECGTVTARSSLYRTAPVGYMEQPIFVNAAALLDTTLAPHALLYALLGIERSFGRDRRAGPPKGPRTLDLDLLYYGELVTDEHALTLPHPALQERYFVLGPLGEIAPHWRHPLLGRTVAEMLEALGPPRDAATRISP